MDRKDFPANADVRPNVGPLDRLILLSPDDSENLDFLVSECAQRWHRPATREAVLSSILLNLALDVADAIIFTPRGPLQ